MSCICGNGVGNHRMIGHEYREAPSTKALPPEPLNLEAVMFRASGMPELYAETVMRQDVPELVAEIRRLEGLVTAAREIAWKRWDHLSFGLLRDRLRRALGGERP